MYAIVDADGNVESLVKGTVEQAVSVAESEGIPVVPAESLDRVPTSGGDAIDLACDLVENPDRVNADYAWERLNYLQIDHVTVLKMSLEEAHSKLLPFFPRLLAPQVNTYPITPRIAEALASLSGGDRLEKRSRMYLPRFRERGWVEGEKLTDRGLEVASRAAAEDFDGYSDVHEAPVFREEVAAAGEYARIYRTPDGMVDAILGQNYKTGKEFPFAPVEVKGLSLLPASLWAVTEGRQVGLQRRVRGGLPVWTRGANINTCIGASAECIKSCLVWSGRNVANPYNMMLKQARTTALMMEPDAFGRILFEACKRHLGTGRRERIPMVRLNVYSDIPWELVYPALFSELPELQFYDYTKVPDRRPPSNYDLTFSYSGRNEKRLVRELGSRRKVAVVFLDTEKWRDGKAEAYSPRAAGLPDTFLGHEVVDGDISDVRPMDAELAEGPPPYVVGLKWKPPKGSKEGGVYLHGGGAGVDPRELRFAVPVHQVDGRLVAAIVPRNEPDVGTEEPDPDEATLVPASELQAEGVVASNPANPRPKRGSPLSDKLKRRLMR